MPLVAGIQTKVLEALAMGLAAVVTRFANDGIGPGANERVLPVDDLSQFAAGVTHVLSDYDRCHNRALHNGRKFVK